MSFQLKALDQLLDLPDTLLPLSQLGKSGQSKRIALLNKAATKISGGEPEKAADQWINHSRHLDGFEIFQNEEDLLQIFAEIYNQAGIDVRRQYLTQLLEYYQKKDLIEYGFMIPRKSKRDESVVLDLTKRYTKWDEKRDTLNVMIFQFMQSQTEKSSIVGKRVPKGSILDTLKQFEQEGIKIWDGDETNWIYILL
ncbi:MAG: hypothetical protein EZS28_029815 [Streblomastix strix]|uniref:Uncharacterized protein n=1 Tax=Streblomastix strix TaxID=222440 RepID=A0A5J4UWJ5_9EUKA|nr:MAG: hypothetical protein EZS28_029815 [Streblomastix strix]